MPTARVNDISWNYTIIGTYPNQKASIGSGIGAGNATISTPAISGAVTIPSPIDGYTVTAISTSAFQNRTNITSVTIPISVLVIGTNCFRGCTQLATAGLPNGITTIHDSAFRDVSLSSVIIPNSVTYLGPGVFLGCKNLTSLTIGTSITTINAGTFQNCSSLTSVNIPNSVTSIGASAFLSCSSLTSVIIPNSVTSIGSQAFQDCLALTSVNIPKSVTSIGASAFLSTSANLIITMNTQTINSIVYTSPTTDKSFFGSSSNVDFVLPPPLTMDITANVANNATTNVQPITLTFTSSTSTNDFFVGGISLTNGSLSAFTPVSATVYTATFAPTGQGACTINVAANVFTDAYGTLNSASNPFTFTFDSFSPNMTIKSTSDVANGSITNVNPIELIFISTEATNNFGEGGIILTNGTLSSSFTAISPTVYTATFTPTGPGPLACTIDVLAGAYTDAATNLNNLATQFAFTYDSVPPTMDISSNVTSGSTTNNETIELTFTSNEATTNFVKENIRVSNGTLSALTTSDNTVYNATFTRINTITEGQCTIDVDAGAYTDAAGNNNIAATTFIWNFETVSPNITITATAGPSNIDIATGATTNYASIELTFTSTEATTGFEYADISVTNGTLGTLTTSDNKVYYATFTPDENGATGKTECSIYVEADKFTDAVGNYNTASNDSTPFTVTFDNTKPTITIESTTVTSGSTTKNTPILLTFILSEVPTGFEYSDISVTNGALGTLTTSDNKVYYAIFTPDESGVSGKTECSISVQADKFTDSVGNSNTASSPFTFTFDSVPPTMDISSNITSGSITNISPIELTFTSSEPITGFTRDDISFNKGTLSDPLNTISDMVYNAIFTPDEQGAYTINVPAGSFIDAAGNSNTAATQFTFTFDSVRPTMDISSNVTSGSTTNNETIELTFTSNEATTNFVKENIRVSNGTLSALTTSDNTVYNATFTRINTITEGQCTIDVDAGAYTDAAGNNNIATETFIWNFETDSPNMTITARAGPSNVEIASGATTNHTSIELTFTSNEATTNFVKENIRVSNGTLSALTTSDNTVYNATFTRINTITEGQCTIDVDAGAYTDAAGNNNIATETFIWNFETDSPNMTIRARAGPSNVEITSGSTTNNETIELTFTSNEATTNFVKENIRVSNGTLSALTTSDNTVYNATFTRINTITEGQCTIDVDAGAYTDAAGNNNNAAETFIWNFETNSPNMTIRATSTAGPNVEIASGATSNHTSIELTFTSSEATTNFVKEDIRVSNGTLSALTTSDNKVYNATFTRINTIPEGQCRIDVDAGAYNDAAGNNNNAATTFIWNFETDSPNMTIRARAAPSNVEITSGATTNHTSIELTFTSSEATTNFVKENIRVSNGTLSSLTTTDNKVYNATFTRINTIAEGQCTIDVDAGAYTDAAGNNNNAATTFIWNFETDSPNMTITARAGPSNVEIASGATTNHTSIELTFTSNEATTNFVKENIRVSNGTLSALTTSDNTVYNATFTRINTITEGQCTIDVDAGAYTDAAGNNNNAATTFIWNFETDSPNMTITARAGPSNVEIASGATTNHTSIDLTFTSSEATTNFVKENIRVSNGTLSSLTTTDNKVYNATFTRINTIAEGQCTIDVDAGAYTDAAGNNNNAATTFIWNFETDSPNMTITARAGPSNVEIASGATTNHTSIELTFTSNEATTNFVKENIRVSNGTLSALTTSDNTVYNATFTRINTITEGQCTIDVDAGAYTDAAGNNNIAAEAFIWNFETESPNITIRATAGPSNVEITSGATTNNETIELTFTSSEATTNFVKENIRVSNGTLSALTTSDNTVYNATFTRINTITEGQCTIDVDAGAYTDAAGNNNIAAEAFIWNFETVSPNITITATAGPSNEAIATGATTNYTPILLTFTLSELPTGFDYTDISVTNGTLGTLTTSDNKVYYATFTPDESGVSGKTECSISVPADKFTDAVGNYNTASNDSTPFTFTFDNTKPTMTISSTTVTSGSTTKNTSIELIFTLSEVPTGFEYADISVTNGRLTAFTGSDTVYTATFTPDESGVSGKTECSIYVEADKFTDAVGNYNTASNNSTPFTFTFDSVPPTMEIIASASGLPLANNATTNNAYIDLTFTSSESTTEFIESDISVTNGQLTNFSGSGAVYTATFTPTGTGACTIDVAAGAFTDAAGNTNTAATRFNLTFRRTVSFDTNTLTIVNSIGTNATDLVLFVLPSGEEMSNINVTAFTGTGTITYDLSTDGESVSSGTFTGTGTNLLGTNVLIASTNTTYILTLVANASLTYTIVGTKRVNYGNVPPTALSFVNNTLTIKNSIVSADVDKVSFDVNAGSILDSLVVTSLLNANSISYALDISGGSTVLSGSFAQAGVNLLNRTFIAPTVKTSYILTLTCGGTNTYSIVGMSQEKSEIDKFCSRHGIPCNNVGYNRLVTSTNNPSVSNKMRYSQLLRSRRFKPITKIGTSVPPPKPEVPLYLFATGQIFAQSAIFPESLI